MANKNILMHQWNGTNYDNLYPITNWSNVQSKPAFLKKYKFSATISTNWIGSNAPYTQTVQISGIQTSDNPKIFPVLNEADALVALNQQRAYSMVSYGVAGANFITFTCLTDKPTIPIPIEIEVIR